jgi:hypothetical protein
MSNFWLIDEAATAAVQGAHSSGKTAMEALSIAARYMRKHEQMPRVLEDYLASAIEAASLKQAEYQGRALLRELGIEAENRRPANLDDIGIVEFIDTQIKRGQSERQSIINAAAHFQASKETIRKRLKLGRLAIAQEMQEEAEFQIMMMEQEHASAMKTKG